MEKKTRAANFLLLVGLGLIGLAIIVGGKPAQAQDITAQQLTELAAVLEELKTCHLQCINTAADEREPYQETARQICDMLNQYRQVILITTTYAQCLHDNTDQTALDGIRLAEGICKDTCLLKVADPQEQGMPALAPAEFDRIGDPNEFEPDQVGDAVSFCQMGCFLTEASWLIRRTCTDNYEPTATGDAGWQEEWDYCGAVEGAHRSLCGRKCTDPSNYSGVATVSVTKTGIQGQDYAQCVQTCHDQHGSTQYLACLEAIDDGLISCPQDDSFLAQICPISTQYCGALNQMGDQHCRFKCMSEHAATQ